MHCHAHGIAHHDIKPGNILLDENGRAKLADFGISIQTTHSGQMTKEFAGSLQYEAPEILNEKAHDPFKSDVWALGVLFAYMISGITPWRGDTLKKIKDCIFRGDYTLKKGYAPQVGEVIGKMIRVDPDERITLVELAQLPLFRDAHMPLWEEIPDCLAPSGRRQLQSVAISTEIDCSTTGECEPARRELLGPKEMTLGTSTMLIIAQRNIMRGISQPPRPPVRYPRNLTTPSFAESR
jgi:serine/threonine protein kinase